MIRSDAPIRAFIALNIPTAAKSALEEAIRNLSAQVPSRVRWVDPGGMHLTLKFLGNVEPAQVDGLVEALRRPAEVSPFRIWLSGLGVFPNERRPRVLWVGLDGDLASLRELQEKIAGEMSGLDFPREARPFSPHLTLGRVQDRVSDGVRRRIGAAVSSATLGPAESWLVDSVHLVRSHLAPGGATYSTLASASLGSAGDKHE